MIATDAAAVTTSDTAYLPKWGFIYVGTTGNVNVLPAASANSDTPGDGVIYKNVPAGFIIPLRVKKVFATSTTAADMVCNQEM